MNLYITRVPFLDSIAATAVFAKCMGMYLKLFNKFSVTEYLDKGIFGNQSGCNKCLEINFFNVEFICQGLKSAYIYSFIFNTMMFLNRTLEHVFEGASDLLQSLFSFYNLIWILRLCVL